VDSDPQSSQSISGSPSFGLTTAASAAVARLLCLIPVICRRRTKIFAACRNGGGSNV